MRRALYPWKFIAESLSSIHYEALGYPILRPTDPPPGQVDRTDLSRWLWSPDDLIFLFSLVEGLLTVLKQSHCSLADALT